MSRRSVMLEQLVAWARSHDDIRALVLTGSHAQGRADALSDLDVELFTHTLERYLDSDVWQPGEYATRAPQNQPIPKAVESYTARSSTCARRLASSEGTAATV